MKPNHAQLLRRVVLNDKEALDSILTGGTDPMGLDARWASLVRIAALLSVDSDASTFEWAVDLGIAAGLEDEEIFDALRVIAPVIGVAKLSSTLPRLMEALDVEVVES